MENGVVLYVSFSTDNSSVLIYFTLVIKVVYAHHHLLQEEAFQARAQRCTNLWVLT